MLFAYINFTKMKVTFSNMHIQKYHTSQETRKEQIQPYITKKSPQMICSRYNIYNCKPINNCCIVGALLNMTSNPIQIWSKVFSIEAHRFNLKRKIILTIYIHKFLFISFKSITKYLTSLSNYNIFNTTSSDTLISLTSTILLIVLFHPWSSKVSYRYDDEAHPSYIHSTSSSVATTRPTVITIRLFVSYVFFFFSNNLTNYRRLAFTTHICSISLNFHRSKSFNPSSSFIYIITWHADSFDLVV